jgi:DmsE family decaheme c-type cytochrome
MGFLAARNHVRIGLRFFGVLGLLISMSAASAKPSKTPIDEPDRSSKYVGAEVCQTCHEEIYKRGFEKTGHYDPANKTHGCESCHGPGAAHVSGGGDVTQILRFKDMSAHEASARCLECHGDSHKQAQFGSSTHLSNNVGCLDCHSPHRAAAEHLLVKAQPELCYGCHGSTRADFAMPFRHRVNEGLVQCKDCHNVHGGGNLRQVRSSATGDAACFRCHADKQGPFVFEHLPVKTEGCGSCHTPHGSTNPRLLRVSQINLLCLQCHTTPVTPPSGPAHNQSQKYQACTLCHPTIHGSNASRVFMK